jgi:hypothetical protein
MASVAQGFSDLVNSVHLVVHFEEFGCVPAFFSTDLIT